jgi:signal transduction histidine kinase
VLRRLNHRILFASAFFLLTLSGCTLAWLFYKTYSSEKWVRHTYSVQLLLSQILFEINQTGRDRQTYLDSDEKQVLQDISDTRRDISAKLKELQWMVRDNPDQLRASQQLAQVVDEGFETFNKSLQPFHAGDAGRDAQNRYSQELVRWARQTSAIVRDMQNAESGLLVLRTVNTRAVFRWAVVIATFSYLLSLYVLWDHYWGLTRELKQRQLAEQNALKLSAQLLSAQDQERRKIARDLHDGLGQVLVAAKMASDALLNRPDPQKMEELNTLLGEAVSSTRSISHLLHPPLVDELGFVSAARSYLEGFSQRTGVQVNCDLPDRQQRLPRDVELILFRILQEALTNIQRHSKSAQAEVQFRADHAAVTLKIRDFGVGLPTAMLQENGSHLGVGLAGMRERVRERKGQFEIRSDAEGTLISATLPLAV